MNGIKGHDYTWNQSWIEFKAPNAQGVYCLRAREGKVIFVGRGNSRERLLSHWNQESPADAEICSYDSAFFGCWATCDSAFARSGSVPTL